MEFFSVFKYRKPKPSQDLKDCADNAVADFQENDFLGKAAEAGHKAKAAVEAKQYDDAWRFYHEQKSFYMRHANRSGFTARQTLALDSSVHEEMANILRIEGKHPDALVHIVYWVLAGADRPIKRHHKKFQSYFNRCRFEKTTASDAIDVVQAQTKMPEFHLARKLVSEWISRG